MHKIQPNPFFAIIIPTIGRVSSLDSAISSVLSQKFKNFEIIIVDNSRESSKKEEVNRLVTSYKDYRIKYLFTTLPERSNARNLGIKNAFGTYICFLDDDDTILKNHLDILYGNIIENNHAVAIYRTGMININEDGKEMHRSIHCPMSENPIIFFLDHMVGIHTLCFHKDVLKRIEFPPAYSYFEDTHLLIRALMRFPFIQINKHTCYYNKIIKEQTIDDLNRMVENNIGCIQDLFKVYEKDLEIHINNRKWEKYMLQKKYLDYGYLSLPLDKRYSFTLFKKSIKLGLHKNLLSRFIIYLLKLLTQKRLLRH